jgi:hypothetical protein
MNPDTIRLRRAVNLVAHTPDQARDRTIAAADHTRVAAAAVDRHPTGAVEVHRPTVAEAAIANHTQAPARTTVRSSKNLRSDLLFYRYVTTKSLHVS